MRSRAPHRQGQAARSLQSVCFRARRWVNQRAPQRRYSRNFPAWRAHSLLSRLLQCSADARERAHRPPRPCSERERARMSRIVITSDLHLGITSADEIAPMIPAIAAEQPDLTIIAGDIGKRLADIHACLDMFAGLPGQVAALAGNHDLWAHDDAHSADLWEQGVPEVVRDAGMLWLEDTVWRRDGLAVAGSIAWYDYTGADPSIPPQTEAYWIDLKQRMHPDGRHLDWPWSDISFATRCGDALVARLAALEADPSVRDVLVVTHVPLFREQLINRTEI